MAEALEGSTAQAAPEQTTEPKVDDKFAGKTPEQLIAMVQERDQTISRQGTEVGEIRREFDRLREEQRQIELARQQREAMLLQQRQAEPEPQDDPDFDFTKPVDSVKRTVLPDVFREFERRDQEARQRELLREQERAKFCFMEGQAKMSGSKSKLYEGIESDISNYLANEYFAGRVHPELLRNEDTWKTVAQVMRLRRGEMDRLMPEKREAVVAPNMDAPTNARQSLGVATPNIEFDEYSDSLIRGLGAAAGIQTREQAMDALLGRKSQEKK